MPTANEVFEAWSKSVSDFFSNDNPGLIIPPYQRAYSWDLEQLESLVSDAIEGVRYCYLGSNLDKNNKMTYIGTIIVANGYDSARQYGFQNPPGYCLLIIDGQQRLTSISIIAICLAKVLSIGLSKVQHLSQSDIALLQFENTANKQLNRLLAVLRINNRPFVRLIRLANDMWQEPVSEYRSTIAAVTNQFITAFDDGTLDKFKARRPGNGGRSFEFKRIEELSMVLYSFLIGGESRSKIFEDLPSYVDITNAVDTNSMLFESSQNFYFDQSNKSATDNEFIKNFSRLLVFTQYYLTRVSFTRVKGLSEDSAFDIFDSLNTTGEPLNAYETLKPQILRQIPQNLLPTAPESIIFEEIESIAQHERKTVKARQKLYNDAIILFALSDQGEKLGRVLSEQTKYLRIVSRLQERKARETSIVFLKECLELTSNFSLAGTYFPQRFYNLLDPDAKLCLEFLKQIKHTIALAPIACAYHLSNRELLKIDDLSKIVRALGAFAVLWRAARGGTAGIDGVFRDLMTGIRNFSSLSPLKRSGLTDINVDQFKTELRERLFKHRSSGYPKLDDKFGWLSSAKSQPLGRQQHVAKFLLLSAQHDAIASQTSPGLIEKGVDGVSRALTLEHFKSDDSYTIEHICPQSYRGGGWSESFSNDPVSIEHIGNLVLLPLPQNNIASNRPWPVKRQFYRALSRRSINEKEIEIRHDLLAFLTSDSISKIRSANYFSPLESVAAYQGEWDVNLVQRRSECLLSLAFDKLYSWLN